MTPLSLTCPANMNVNGATGGQLTPVTYTTPQAVFGAPPYQPVVCNPPSGSVFNTGQVTNVFCTVLDSVGANAFCQFSINVIASGKISVHCEFFCLLPLKKKNI